MRKHVLSTAATSKKILWVSPFFLHPVDRGAKIRSLGTLRELHSRHEVHFAALWDPSQPEGIDRAYEYCSHFYPVRHALPARGSAAFLPQLAASILSPLPLTVSRYQSSGLTTKVSALWRGEAFDALLCDFLAAAPNVPDMGDAILFQHNVESTIWERHAAHGETWAHRRFFQLQANRMKSYERQVCRQAAHVIAVSDLDAKRMRTMFDIENVTAVPTGVDTDYFYPSSDSADHQADLVFTGSMDWLPNVDGVEWFAREVLPLIRQRKPDCRVAIVGRDPAPKVAALGAEIPGFHVTGTVPDIRPWLWGSKLAIVPLRIGGGTRLKIYESMAAGIPVLSTTIGAEGLDCQPGREIEIADSAADLALACLALLDQPMRRADLAASALRLVREKFSWSRVARDFEDALLRNAVKSSRQS